VYSAISIASTVGKYIYCREPLAINGASRHSTGTSYFSSGKDETISPVQMFSKEGNIPFHEDIPLCLDGSYPPSMHALVYESYLQSSDLRVESKEELPARMLTIILATAGRHQLPVQEWARIFAQKHRLDFDSIRSKAKVAAIKLVINSVSSQAVALLNTFSVGSFEFPIPDVYEASIAAGAIRAIGVGRSKNILRLLRRMRRTVSTRNGK
jgi:hypothetical protein